MWGLRKLLFGPASAEKVADKIIKKISRAAFQIFRDEDIRKMLNFSQLDQVEQDRIFNEFVVTGLSLAILMIETVSDLSEGERAFFYKKLKREIPFQYLNQLEELGIARQYVDMWGGLIEMRCEEYRKDFEEHRSELPKPTEVNPWISVVGIGGLHHLRRGKTSPKDPLFKHLLAWLRFLAIETEKLLTRAI